MTSHLANVNDVVIGAGLTALSLRSLDGEHHEVENRSDDDNRDDERRPYILVEWINYAKASLRRRGACVKNAPESGRVKKENSTSCIRS